MQAPTRTDDGHGGRDPQDRPCPSCGADNTSSATFCWRCYRAFAPPSGGLPPPPPTTVTPARRSHLGARAMMAAIAVGVAAAVGFVMLRQPDPELPERVGALTRTSDAVSEAAASSFRATSSAQDLEADIAFYGAAGTPEVALAWIHGTSPGGAAESFDGFTAGFTADSGGSVVTAERVERAVDGVTYICAPVGGPVAAGICLWEEGELSWILMDVRPGSTIAETRSLAVAANDTL